MSEDVRLDLLKDAAREYSRAAGVAAWRRDALKKRRGR